MTTQESPKTRRHFEPAFKLQVSKMIRDQDISLNRVCQDMNLVPNAVRHWVVQLDEEAAGHPSLSFEFRAIVCHALTQLIDIRKILML